MSNHNFFFRQIRILFEKIRQVGIFLKRKICQVMDFCKRLKKPFEILYHFASVVSSFTIFFGIIFYAIGHISKNNQSDNDLIMNQIKAEIKKGKISSIRIDDIHGFGYNSILATIDNKELVSKDNQNKFIIMDSVENDILHSMNDLLGLKSSYKVTFSYTLKNDKIDLHPQVDYVFDMIDDSTKEIVVKYGVHGHRFATKYNYMAIFKYSYDNEQYEIIGTYPICEKVNLITYEGEGERIETPQRIETEFNNLGCKKEQLLECYDKEKRFNLTGFWSGDYRDYWATTKYFGKVLILVKLDIDNWNALVNCYQPSYENEKNKLSWNIIYSENIEITKSNCEDEVLDKLIVDMDRYTKFLER